MEPSSPGVNFANAIPGGRCRIGDGYIHPDFIDPDFPDSAPDKVQPSGPARQSLLAVDYRTSHQLRDDDRHVTGVRLP